ncbi:MAG: sigma-54-dependent Fis family transcriptional regulator [Verrucomicrobia bacterium]|nr:sigma-54-dependent Fis family transcriptional regulator [Verrucomicrobiota bacterium]
MRESKPRVLIADDQSDILSALAFICTAEGYETVVADSPQAVLALVRAGEFDLLLMDMNFDVRETTGEGGLELLRQVTQLDPLLSVVVMTAYGSIPLAVEALRLGAKDFLQKPWENERLLSILRTQLQLRRALHGRARLEAENRLLRQSQATRQAGFVAHSAAMQRVERIIRQVAPSDANLLITGDNGTGKGVVARRIHELSERSQGSFISVNMGGLPDSLFESEMFGHVKGAFTDARSERVGRFELADNGTIFLDEIANLTGSQQAKILRVLETGEFEKIGSSKTLRVNARILSATNADLRAEIAAGRFREDLLFRLNTVEIHLPALRERVEDIPALADHFISELSQRYRKEVAELSPDALAWLKRCPWPGNVRELRHALERAVLLTSDGRLKPEDFGLQTPSASQTAALDDMDLDAMEGHLIRKALQRCGGNALQAAKALGLSRSAFYRRLQKHGLSPSSC